MIFLLFTAIAGMLSVLLAGSYRFTAFTFLAGYFVGIVTRDFGWSLRTILHWPLVTRVLDWDKIERLLQETAEPGGPKS